MYYVYVLHSSKDGKLYTGFSENLDQRLKEHQNGLVTSTKHRLPIKLIYYEAYVNKLDALKREVFLKSGSGKRFLKKQIEHYLKENMWETD